MAHSTRIALAVGPALIAINNYDHLLTGSLPVRFWPKALTTLLVPFLVSLYSALHYASRCDRPLEARKCRR